MTQQYVTTEDMARKQPMTHGEIMADINDRIDRRIIILAGRSGRAGSLRDRGKVDGLKLVKDWLRSYEGMDMETSEQ